LARGLNRGPPPGIRRAAARHEAAETCRRIAGRCAGRYAGRNRAGSRRRFRREVVGGQAIAAFPTPRRRIERAFPPQRRFRNSPGKTSRNLRGFGGPTVAAFPNRAADSKRYFSALAGAATLSESARKNFRDLQNSGWASNSNPSMNPGPNVQVNRTRRTARLKPLNPAAGSG
jgi:hypothetical protein